jgi:hypothetical protein
MCTQSLRNVIKYQLNISLTLAGSAFLHQSRNITEVTIYYSQNTAGVMLKYFNYGENLMNLSSFSCER